MGIRIKVCGLRRDADVQACVDAGVDAIGFNCWTRSPRYVSAEEAAKLAAGVPPSTLTVGVFVRATPEEVARVVAIAGFGAVQLHGDEDPELYASVPAQIIQVVRMKSLAALPGGPASPSTRLVLLDAHVDEFGGAGRSFDWSLVPEAKRRMQRDVIVGGGLSAENVAEAIRIGQPWGVDVASGVESSPGLKDHRRLNAFVAAARAGSDG